MGKTPRFRFPSKLDEANRIIGEEDDTLDRLYGDGEESPEAVCFDDEERDERPESEE